MQFHGQTADALTLKVGDRARNVRWQQPVTGCHWRITGKDPPFPHGSFLDVPVCSAAIQKLANV